MSHQARLFLRVVILPFNIVLLAHTAVADAPPLAAPAEETVLMALLLMGTV